MMQAVEMPQQTQVVEMIYHQHQIQMVVVIHQQMQAAIHQQMPVQMKDHQTHQQIQVMAVETIKKQQLLIMYQLILQKKLQIIQKKIPMIILMLHLMMIREMLIHQMIQKAIWMNSKMMVY